jgi:monoterpene epsilon-lactone hydrolase
MPSWQSKLVMTTMRQLKKRVTHIVDDIPRLRTEKEFFMSKLWAPAGMHYDALRIEHLEAEWIMPKKPRHDKVMLYLHGGGYALGSINTHRSLIARISKEAGIRILAINYRLAPEHPFPAALDDAVLAYTWLIEHAGYRPEDILLAGDSAGGGLTISTMLALRQVNLPLPLAAVVLCPWTDLAGTGPSMRTKAESDPLLPACKLRAWGRQYAGDTSVRHPLVSPLYADLSGLPPLLIHVGTEEIVFDDSTRIAERAREAGTPVTLEVWEGMPHVWHFSWHLMPEARRAISNIARFVEARIDDGKERPKTDTKVTMLRHVYEATKISAAILGAAVVRNLL